MYRLLFVFLFLFTSSVYAQTPEKAFQKLQSLLAHADQGISNDKLDEILNLFSFTDQKKILLGYNVYHNLIKEEMKYARKTTDKYADSLKFSRIADFKYNGKVQQGDQVKLSFIYNGNVVHLFLKQIDGTWYFHENDFIAIMLSLLDFDVINKENKVKRSAALLKSNLRNAATSQEAYYIDNETYLSCKNQECIDKLPGLSRFNTFDGVNIEMICQGNEREFQIWIRDKNENSKIYKWNSERGGMQTGESHKWPN